SMVGYYSLHPALGQLVSPEPLRQDYSASLVPSCLAALALGIRAYAVDSLFVVFRRPALSLYGTFSTIIFFCVALLVTDSSDLGPTRIAWVFCGACLFGLMISLALSRKFICLGFPFRDIAVMTGSALFMALVIRSLPAIRHEVLGIAIQLAAGFF